MFWLLFDDLGLLFSLLTIPNIFFPLFCPRHLWKALSAQLHGPGDVSLQDLHPPRTAQPRLQGNFHLPGCPLPALRRHAHDLHIQQAQHEAQGDGRLDLHGAEQQRAGRAKSLAGNEGIKGDAGLQVAHAARVLMVTGAACRSWDPWVVIPVSGKQLSHGKHCALPGLVRFNLAVNVICREHCKWQGLGSKFTSCLCRLPCIFHIQIIIPREKQRASLQNPLFGPCLAHFVTGLTIAV